MGHVEDFYFPSSNGNDKIRVRKWTLKEKPRAVLQIVHGIVEHIERYDDFANYVRDKGIVVVGDDHLGHGKSVANEEGYGFFAEENGWNFMVKDLHTLYKMTSSEYPDVPYFILGHSMGSFLTRTYLIDYPQGLSGAILSGTGQQSPIIINAGLALIKAESRKDGMRKRSDKVDAICFGAYNRKFKPNRTNSDWLSRDEVQVDKKIVDPACNFVPTLSGFRDMLNGIKYIEKQGNLERMNKKLPVFFLSGDHDPVGSMGKGVKKAYKSFLKAGCRDVTLKLYEGGRHEMLNEINRQEVYEDILKWLEVHISG